MLDGRAWVHVTEAYLISLCEWEMIVASLFIHKILLLINSILDMLEGDDAEVYDWKKYKDETCKLVRLQSGVSDSALSLRFSVLDVAVSGLSLQLIL
jgi:hypothetical protein